MDRTQMVEIDELISVDMDTINNNINGFSELISGHLLNIQRQANANTPLPLTEQNYLDLANTTKEIIAEKDEVMLKMQKQLTECKNMLYKVYGLTSFVGDVLNGFDGNGGVEDTMAHNLEYINCELEKLFKKMQGKRESD